jgi:aminoglycoside phosphotransferase (APT) family kinase protein
MIEEYLGILESHDPLYDILASRAFPDIPHPIFHVSRMSRPTVYKYTEERTGKSLVGKFYDTRRNGTSGAPVWVDEYENLRAIRSFGFDTSPHVVVRPLWRETGIGLALIEEFIDGRDLDHYFKGAVYEGNGKYLEMKLAELASFFFALHNTTSRSGYVDLRPQGGYFQRILDTLKSQGIIAGSDYPAYLALRDTWINHDVMKAPRKGIVHGDPTPTNFIFTHEGDIVAIDLERMKEADAVFDLGIVSAEIKHTFFWRTGDRYASEPYITHFFSQYAVNFPNPAHSFRRITQRNPFYMALAELRIARNNYLDTEYRKKLAYEAFQCLMHGLSLLETT